MSKKSLGVFALTMINIIAVDSLRSLPFSAEYGLSLVFYYLLAALTFFLPIGFVSAELASAYPARGGIYVWVREAFGKEAGFIIIYLQWIYNIVWYPTILSLLASVFAYLIDPALAQHKGYMFGAVMVLFWGATLLNWFGMKTSSFFSAFGALIGTLIPILFIIVLGIIWIAQGNPVEMDLHFFPTSLDGSHLAFLSAILFGLIGLEMSAVHADEVDTPRKTYPKAIFLSALIILTTLMGGSLAISMVIPTGKLNVITGLIEAYQFFLNQFNLGFLSPIINLLIIIGGISTVGAWIIGPSKGLMVAADEGCAPKFLGRRSKRGVPTATLLLQGLLFTLLSSLFIFLPTISSSYWLLSAMTAQLALIVYIALFLAGIKLHRHKIHLLRRYRAPLMPLLCALGIASSLFGITVGFFPPANIPIPNLLLYESLLIGGILILSALPIAIYTLKNR